MFKLFAIFLLLTLPAYADSPVAWSYDGDNDGQEVWGGLSHLYAACEMGHEQSPVNIAYTKFSNKPPIAFSYRPIDTTKNDNAHIFTFEVKDGSMLSSEGVEYTLKTIAFHSPSEHVVQGKFYLLEIEMLHEDKDGKRLMLSVFGEKGEQNAALDQLLNAALTPEKPVLFDASGLLPKDHSYYAYRGSLTYPPCTEGVEWRVLKTPITLSKKQLSAITSYTGRNARLTQPVYMRTIEETR